MPHIAVTRQSLLSAGRSRGLGDAHVRRGQWQLAAPSTFLTAAQPELPDLLCAALAHAGADAVVTGWAGCALLDLPYVVHGGAVPVLVPEWRRRVSTAYVRVLPTTRHPRWWLHGQIRVASPARCVVDAARGLPDLRAVRALVLGAVPSVGLAALQHELEAGAKGGSALCRRALADGLRGSASAPEAEFADHALAAAGEGRMPRFLLNPDIVVAGVPVGRPDGWLVGAGVGWEMDSAQFHAKDDLFETTMARHDRFSAHGLVLLHMTPLRMRQRGAACTAALEQAARSRGREPAGLVVVERGPLLPLPRDPQKKRPRTAAQTVV